MPKAAVDPSEMTLFLSTGPNCYHNVSGPRGDDEATRENRPYGRKNGHDIIVKQHAGSIDVETEPGEFTEIRVILPRTAVFI